MLSTIPPPSCKEAKIIPFVLVSQAGSNLHQAEQLLGELLNDGWTITAAGGAGGDAGDPYYPWADGFIVLVRDRPTSHNGYHANKATDDEIWTADDAPGDYLD